MANFFGLQTFNNNGVLTFDSSKRWARMLDKFIMKNMPPDGNKSYNIPYGRIVVAPFVIFIYDNFANQVPLWDIKANGSTVSWHNNNYPYPIHREDPSFAFILWID